MRTHSILVAAMALAVPTAAAAQAREGNNMTWIDYSGRLHQTETPNDGRAHMNFAVTAENTDYFRGVFDGVPAGVEDYSVNIDPTVLFTLFDQGDVSALRFNLVLGAQNAVSGAQPFGDLADGPRIWYEANPFVGGVFEAGPGFRLGAVFTAYTSPNGVLDTRQEVALSAGYGNNRNFLGRLQPYALLAMQLTDVDGNQGTYGEAGFRPQFDLAQNGMGELQLALPVFAGVALDDYYGEMDDDYPLFVRAGLEGSFALGTVRSEYGAWRIVAGADMLWRENALTDLTFANGTGTPVVDDAGNYVWTGRLGLSIAY